VWIVAMLSMGPERYWRLKDWLHSCGAKIRQLYSRPSLSEEQRREMFTALALPVTRRVFSNLTANEIVSVQPMTQPAGSVFDLDYLYGRTQGHSRRTPANPEGSVLTVTVGDTTGFPPSGAASITTSSGHTQEVAYTRATTGSALLETGFIYAPYVPIQVTPRIIRDQTFAQRPVTPADTLRVSYQIELDEPKPTEPPKLPEPPKPKLIYRAMDLEIIGASTIDAHHCVRRMDLVD
jgi:hypothetical protein